MVKSTRNDRLSQEEGQQINDSARRVQFFCCTEPGCKERFESVITHNRKPEQYLAKIATNQGWHINLKKRQAVCPKHGREPVKSASLTPPRTPTPADRRRIFKAIEDAYDTAHSCYCDPITDQSIADELKVPWAWVSEQREMNFGPAGPAPEIVAARKEAENLRGQVSAVEKVLYEQVDKLDKLNVALAKLEEKVSKI